MADGELCTATHHRVKAKRRRSLPRLEKALKDSAAQVEQQKIFFKNYGFRNHSLAKQHRPGKKLWKEEKNSECVTVVLTRISFGCQGWSSLHCEITNAVFIIASAIRRIVLRGSVSVTGAISVFNTYSRCAGL